MALLAWAQLVSWSSCPWLLRNRRHRWCLRITLVDQLPFADTFSFSGSLQIHLAFASFVEQTFVLQILLALLVRAHLFFFPIQLCMTSQIVLADDHCFRICSALVDLCRFIQPCFLLWARFADFGGLISRAQLFFPVELWMASQRPTLRILLADHCFVDTFSRLAVQPLLL